MTTRRILFLVRRVGPYHAARFEAAGRRLDLTVVETRPSSAEYPWDALAGARDYRVDAFRRAAVPEEGLRGLELQHEVARVLDAGRPDVVACSGWADREYHVALRWCQQRGIPAIVMSDSTQEDEPRTWWREAMKGVLVRGFGAAVVAGSRSRDYLARLGFPRHAIFQPLDVVDNEHFSSGAERARRACVKESAGVPRRFLCVARFIPKKNLEGLLIAYARYVALAGPSAWILTLSGSGPLEAALRRQVDELGIATRVEFAGFLQYPALPAAYARAGALILPSWSDQWGLVVNEAMAAGLPVLVSRHCGCVPELVREGENGWIFDPHDAAMLQDCLGRVSALPDRQWQEMSRRSRELVAGYAPDIFAGALEAAVATVLAPQTRKSPRLSRAMIGLMALRHESAS